MFYLKWEQRAAVLWPGLLRGNQTLGFCAATEIDALILTVRWSDGVWRRSTLSSLCSDPGCVPPHAVIPGLHRDPFYCILEVKCIYGQCLAKVYTHLELL